MTSAVFFRNYKVEITNRSSIYLDEEQTTMPEFVLSI